MRDIPDLKRLDWKDLYPRVLLYIEGRLRRMSWLGERGGPIPGGYTAQDFFQSTYLKFAEGIRAWNPELTPFQNFVSAVSSEISNRANARENTHTKRADDNVIQLIRNGQRSPEDEAAYKLELKTLVSSFPKTDDKSQRMAHLILVYRIENLHELAAAMGLPQNIVDATKRRLRTYVVKYLEKNPTSVFVRVPAKASSSPPNIPPDAAGVATNDQ